MDTYLTIKDMAEAQLTEKRSRFLAFAHHVNDEEEAKNIVAQYKKKYYDAKHVCFAYIIGNNNELTRANDDGEPSGTAGRPILGQITAQGLTYVLIVVVRYFGGVKLGTGPLGLAYKTVAAQALAAAERSECVITNSFRISVPYADADVAMRLVREKSAKITDRSYTPTETSLTICVRCDDEQALRERLAKIFTLHFLEN